MSESTTHSGAIEGEPLHHTILLLAHLFCVVPKEEEEVTEMMLKRRVNDELHFMRNQCPSKS